MNISKDKTDRLFAEKLGNHEVKPRAQAWGKLEGRLQQKQRKIMPVWQRMGIAASVLILLFAGGVSFFNNNDKSAENQPVAANSTVKNEVIIAKNKSEISNSANSKKEIIEQTNPTVVKNKLRKSEVYFAGNTRKEEKKSTVKVENNEVETPILQPIIAKEVPLIAQNTLPNIPGSKLIETKKTEDLTIVFTVANFEESSQALNTDEEKLENEKNPKYLFRFFKQLINAKNGDKVNWNEVGFKPAKILARAENKLKLTKDELNGSYQTVKNKTIL